MAIKHVCSKWNHAEDKLVIHLEPSLEKNQIVRMAGQMLVDSEKLAFVYLVDCKDGYHYVVFNRNQWPTLKESLEDKRPVYILTDEGELELVQFHSELAYLLSNIQDNPNYGEKMNEEVRRIFFNKD